MKRTAVAVVTVLFVAFVSLRCTQAESPARSTTTSSAKAFKVGLLTPGSVNDNGWNAIAYEGLQRIKNDLGAEVSNQETKTPAEFEEGFKSYGQIGLDFAVGHFFWFEPAAIEVWRLYPKTVFIPSSRSSVSRNVSP